MTQLVISHDADGQITDWRYEPSDKYDTASDEIIPTRNVNHRQIARYRVDVSRGELEPNPNHTPPLDQREIERIAKSADELTDRLVDESFRQSFKEARKSGDVQAQLDALFELVTGDGIE